MYFFIISFESLVTGYKTTINYYKVLLDWNYNNLNAKDPVAMGLFNQKDLIEAVEKAERRIKREKKEKEKIEKQKKSI